MSIADKDGLIWYDGKLVPWREATTHVLTYSLHYSFSIFEGVRVYSTPEGPAIFRLQDHTNRFFQSAHIVGMDIPFDQRTLNEAQQAVVRGNHLQTAYIRPLGFYSSDTLKVAAKNLYAHVMIAAWQQDSGVGKPTLQEGIRVKTSSFSRYPVNVHMCQAKASANYFNSILASREALQDGYDDALLLDIDGYVAEGTTANIFTYRQGKLYTPEATVALAGITRDTVIQLASALQIPVIEKRLTRNDIYSAEEAFFTGSAAEICPIKELDHRQIGEGTRGPTTEKIQQLYFDCVHGKNETFQHWLTYIEKST